MRKLATTGRRLTAELSYQTQRALSGDTGGSTAGPRDRILARSIKGIVEEGTITAVLGWEHVSEKVPGNVASLLTALQPLGFLVVGGTVVRLY
jgi:hypothetical protein